MLLNREPESVTFLQQRVVCLLCPRRTEFLATTIYIWGEKTYHGVSIPFLVHENIYFLLSYMFFCFLIICFVYNYYVAKQRGWSEYELTEPSGTRSTWNSQKVLPVHIPIQLSESESWELFLIISFALSFCMQLSTEFHWLLLCNCLLNHHTPFHLQSPFWSKLWSSLTRLLFPPNPSSQWSQKYPL